MATNLILSSIRKQLKILRRPKAAPQDDKLDSVILRARIAPEESKFFGFSAILLLMGMMLPLHMTVVAP